MQLLETDNKPSEQAQRSDWDYKKALNSIAAGYCDEQEKWVLNELLELCRQGASDADLHKRIAPFDVPYPQRIVSIVRTVVRAEILKAAEQEIMESSATATPVVSRAMQTAVEMAAASHSRYQFYSDLRELGIGKPFAASLAAAPRIRSQFRYRLPGHLALSLIMTVVGFAWFLQPGRIETNSLLLTTFSLVYLFKNLLHTLFEFRIPRPSMDLLGDALKN